MVGRRISYVVIFDTTAKVTRYGQYTAGLTGFFWEFRSRKLAPALIISEPETYFPKLISGFCVVVGDVYLLMTDDGRATESDF